MKPHVLTPWVMLLLQIMMWTGCDGGEPPPATATLSGTVLEAHTATPVVGATVQVGVDATTTDQEGRFALQDVAVESVLLQVDADGYEPYEEQITVQEGANSHDVTLEPEVLAVEVTKDLTYALPANEFRRERPLDVYAPSEPGGWPVAVVLHGGSSGPKDAPLYVGFSQRLAERGVVVFNASYLHQSTGSGTVLANNYVVLREILESAVCAVRYARLHADEYGGDPSRLNVIGASLGGFTGGLASFLGDELRPLLEDFEESEGGPPDQMTCVAAEADASVHGFVGFNGAYFALEAPELDTMVSPELRSLVNLDTYLGRNPPLTIRFIFGANDEVQPAWHIERAMQLIPRLQEADYDAEAVTVGSGHFIELEGTAWGETLAVLLDVVSR